MTEYLFVACNFRFPVDVFVSGKQLVGLVEQIVDNCALINGDWYDLEAITWQPQQSR